MQHETITETERILRIVASPDSHPIFITNLYLCTSLARMHRSRGCAQKKYKARKKMLEATNEIAKTLARPFFLQIYTFHTDLQWEDWFTYMFMVETPCSSSVNQVRGDELIILGKLRIPGVNVSRTSFTKHEVADLPPHHRFGLGDCGSVI